MEIFALIGLIIGFVCSVLAYLISNSKGRDGCLWALVTMIWTGVGDGFIVGIILFGMVLGDIDSTMKAFLGVMLLFANLPIIYLVFCKGRKRRPCRTRRKRIN